uniref:Uncharacterized protein n=1 Tax=Lygus hesperus TaxID=30085 RepID=A0A0A9YR08_LYGHE
MSGKSLEKKLKLGQCGERYFDHFSSRGGVNSSPFRASDANGSDDGRKNDNMDDDDDGISSYKNNVEDEDDDELYMIHASSEYLSLLQKRHDILQARRSTQKLVLLQLFDNAINELQCFDVKVHFPLRYCEDSVNFT